MLNSKDFDRLPMNRRQFLQKLLRTSLVSGAAIYTIQLSRNAFAGTIGGSGVTVDPAEPAGPAVPI